MPPAAPSDVGGIRVFQDSHWRQAKCRLLSLVSGMCKLYYHPLLWLLCMLQYDLTGVQSPYLIKGLYAPAPGIVSARS